MAKNDASLPQDFTSALNLTLKPGKIIVVALGLVVDQGRGTSLVKLDRSEGGRPHLRVRGAGGDVFRSGHGSRGIPK
jgi:dUTPase